MDQEEIKRLLRKRAEELTTAERQLLEGWYESVGRDATTQPFADAADEQQAKHRLRERIAQRRHERPGYRLNGKLPQWIAAAAVILLVAGATWLYWRPDLSPADNQSMASEVRQVTLRAESGKLNKVQLSDGSLVWLNGNSEITVPERFTDTLRSVLLVGEAFFEVTADAARPFVITSGQLTTQVLGTSFNIKAYPGVDRMVVNVATGKVAVRHTTTVLAELTMDQQLVFDRSTSGHRIERYSSRHANGWREGAIWLEGVAFDELASLFANTFGYTLESRSRRLDGVRFTASFRRQDRLKDILDMLCKIPGVNYKIEGRVITMF